VSGVWGVDAYLDFADDGTFSGNAGCNLIYGDWRADDTGIVFGSVAMTQVRCEGRPDWAATPRKAVIQDSGLTLLDSHGNTITVLAPHRDE
jgi:heat shock protein HslJ